MKAKFNPGELGYGEYRENVSYAVGEPLGEFDYIPHVVFLDGSVWLPKESVQLLWDYRHPDWYENNCCMISCSHRDCYRYCSYEKGHAGPHACDRHK